MDESRHGRFALLSILACGLLPWLVIDNTAGDFTLVMGWGLVNTDPWHAMSLYQYLGHTAGFATLPIDLQAWPLGFLFYLLAIGSATSGLVFDREDPRLTGGLLLLTTIASLWLWVRFLRLGLRQVAPVGPIAIVAVVWYFYWPAFRSGLPASDPDA